MSCAARRIISVFSVAVVLSCCGNEQQSPPARKDAVGKGAGAVVDAGLEKARPEAVTRPVLLFGLDGATFELLDPLMAKGLLPNFSRLVAAGSRAPLETYKPTLSPLIWTTIATGVGPGLHGIQGFVAPIPGTQEQAIVTSNMRRVRALWNILSEQKTTVGVVGWWATYPAEAVNGFVISDQANDLRRENYRRAVHLDEEKGRSASRDPRGVFPASLGTEMAAQLQLSPEITREEIGRFFALPADKEYLLSQPLGNDEDILSILKFSYLIDKSFLGAGLRAFARYKPSFAAIYLNGLDGAEHHFWKFMAPEGFTGVTKKDAARYGDVIRNYYIYMDEVLGRLLEVYPLESSAVIVVSDHGHEPNTAHDPASSDHFNRVCSGTHEAAPDGILIMAGKDIEKGGDLSGATVFDVTPTVLALLGSPVGVEMKGRVLTNAVAPAFLAAHPIRKVEGLIRRLDHSDAPIPSEMNDALKEKLKGLGYIE